MRFKDYIKKSAFTLAEIIIALFIIAVLAMVTLPVINRQLDKTDEYAYYMAFKTVEKMASQVVSLGEPYKDDDEETTSFYYDGKSLRKYTWKDSLAFKFKLFFNDIKTKIVYTESTLRRKLFPKAFAASETEISTGSRDLFSTDTFVTDIWLGYRVCESGNGSIPMRIVSTTKDEETGELTYTYAYYDSSNFGGCFGYDDSLGSNEKVTVKGQVITGPINAHEVLMGFLPPLEAFKSTNLENEGNQLKSSVLTKILDQVGYSSGTPNGGKALCTELNGLLLKSGDYKSTDEYKVYYETKWVDEEEEIDDPDEPDEDEKTAEDSGADLDDSYINYSAKVKKEDRGVCQLIETTEVKYDTSSGGTVSKVDPPKFSDDDCRYGNNGYYNMRNIGAPDTIECIPEPGYIYSENNPKYACDPRKAKNSNQRCFAYKDGSIYTDEFCDTDFNENKKECCAKGATFIDGECKCASGYVLKGDKCKVLNCPPGYSEKTENGETICILNPPIIKAKRFCELVAETWNIKKDYCSSITYDSIPNLPGAKYYKSVFDAVLGNSDNTKTRLLSIDSQPGKFAYNYKTESGLKPNLILANGLYMWILSDRVSSIPGLTFTTDDAKPERNVCRNLKKDTKEACAAADSNAYFCASDNGCYKISDSSIDMMGDARNCCGAPDLSDIAASKASGTGAISQDAYFLDPRVYAISGFTVLVDINGSRGSGTLWEDVFPFYVASNGMVYPGYPLDANKTYNKNSSNSGSNVNLGGNSEAQLPTDVYHYEGREKKVLLSNVSYARALCTARKINKNSPYCLNLGEKFYQRAKFKKNDVENTVVEMKGTEYLRNDSIEGSSPSNNPCDYTACYVSVRRKLRAF